jgi:hypothetical protein
MPRGEALSIETVEKAEERLLTLVLGELRRREFAGLHVAFVQFRILLPLFWQVVERKNRRHRTDRDAGATIDAFHGINVELWNVVECGATVVIGRILLGMDAIHGTGIDARGVFGPDAGFGNDIGHRPIPLAELRVCPPDGRFKGSRGKLVAYDTDD